MISNRNEALIAGLAYRNLFTAWALWQESHARRAFDEQIDPAISNPAYGVHLWREFELAAFSGDSRLIAPERTFTVAQISRLMCLSYQTVRSADGLIVIEGRVSAADFVTYANMQTNRQRELI